MWTVQMLTIYEESQGIFNLRSVLAQMFGSPKENVRVITKFVGSGFGSKLWPWTHCALAVSSGAATWQTGQARASAARMMFQISRSSPSHSATRAPRRHRLKESSCRSCTTIVNDRAMLDALSRKLW